MKNSSNIALPMEEYLNTVTSIIIEKLDTGVPLIDSSTRELFIRGGKQFRASLVLLSSGLKGPLPEGVFNIAAAAEIIHGATLIHDDIIDHALLRRGGKSIPLKWGNKISVLAGDFLYVIGLELTITDGNQELFPVMVDGTKDMVKGELFQLQNANFDHITEEQYFTTIYLKTARFMATCAKLGAIKAGYSTEECEKLYQYGINIGYAFQIVDDNLDIEESAEANKDTANDFADGKVTLPIIYLYNNSVDDDKQKIINSLKNPDKNNWNYLKDSLEQSGALDYTKELAHSYIDKAKQLIAGFEDSHCKSLLLELAENVINRKY